MKLSIAAFLSMAAVLCTTLAAGQSREPAVAKKPPAQTSTTTQQAADAMERQGKTGTSNQTAAKALKDIEAQEKAAYEVPKSKDKKK